jgi:hypothetical protein
MRREEISMHALHTFASIHLLQELNVMVASEIYEGTNAALRGSSGVPLWVNFRVN